MAGYSNGQDTSWKCTKGLPRYGVSDRTCVFNPPDKGIVSIVGYSSDKSVQARIKYAMEKAFAKRPGPVMAMLDSGRDEANVSQELAFIAPFISVGSYLIVEDTNVNGHPSAPEFWSRTLGSRG